MHFFNFLHVSFENFKQLVLSHLDVHSGWELHRIHHHLSNQNVYFNFHSILKDFLHHFEKLTLSRIPTRWGGLEAPKGCPIRKYSGECFALCQLTIHVNQLMICNILTKFNFQIQFVTFRRGHPWTPIDPAPIILSGKHCSPSHIVRTLRTMSGPGFRPRSD